MGELRHALQLFSATVTLEINDVAAGEPPAAAIPSIARLRTGLFLRFSEPAKEVILLN
jgi:hypothetical protein